MSDGQCGITAFTLPGQYAPWNYHLLELSLPGTFTLWNFCSRIANPTIFEVICYDKCGSWTK